MSRNTTGPLEPKEQLPAKLRSEKKKWGGAGGGEGIPALTDYMHSFISKPLWSVNPTNRLTIEERSIAIDRDWVKHDACRMFHCIYITTHTFVTQLFFLNCSKKVDLPLLIEKFGSQASVASVKIVR